jgi:hypothetical protein
VRQEVQEGQGDAQAPLPAPGPVVNWQDTTVTCVAIICLAWVLVIIALANSK